MTCCVFKGAGSEIQSSRQVDAERKPGMGRGKLCVMVILVRMVLIWRGGWEGQKQIIKP